MIFRKKRSERIHRCIDCGASFGFTPIELRAYAELGQPAPSRCRSCRKHEAAETTLEAVPQTLKVRSS